MTGLLPRAPPLLSTQWDRQIPVTKATWPPMSGLPHPPIQIPPKSLPRTRSPRSATFLSPNTKGHRGGTVPALLRGPTVPAEDTTCPRHDRQGLASPVV